MELTDPYPSFDNLVKLEEISQGQEQADQKRLQSEIPRQPDHDHQDDATHKHLVMQPYKRLLSPTPFPQFEIEIQSLGVTEPSLSALHSGIVTNTGTGITTPDQSDINDCPPIYKWTGKPQLDEVRNKLHRSYTIDFKAEGQHERYTAHCNQTDIPGSSSNMTHATPQKIETQPVEVGDDTIPVDAHQQVLRASDRPLLQRRVSEEKELSDTSPHQKGLGTGAVDVLGVTKQEQTTVTANTNRTENIKFQKVNMPELLKTSNRLLEDGRRLLAGAERQPRPRQAQNPVGEESNGEPVNKGPDSPPSHSPSGRPGWYAYELKE
ncbi:hypothetical protein VMCG_09287 [Cytospora schulzeri]|uniref:Uncharacterized protein n=1 Tax=Cytospora schulzeri TaxID=448051 RepID=A0A423VMC2_9PEZI|nr:hypothetical protein VMCG_09287 [Valsa malicola]